MKRIAGYLALVIILVAGTGCSSADDEEGRGGWGGGGDREPPSVEAVLAEFGGLPLEARVSGTVRAERQVDVYPEISERVERVHVESGEYVEAGAPLVSLRDRAYRDRLRQAEADLRIARADARSARASLAEAEARLSRVERLVEQEFESPQELESVRAQVASAEASVDQAEGRVEQAEAAVEERQEDLQQTVIRAPFSGYIGNREVQEGQRVDTNTLLFVIGDLSTVRIRIPIPDRLFGQIEAGQTVEVRPDGQEDRPLRATVSRISPFLQSDTYSARAEIDMPNEDQRLLPGMFVQVDILYGESEQATLVPRSAIYENPRTGEKGVFTASELSEEVPIERTSEGEEERASLTEPTMVRFQPVDIIAEGRDVAGIRGIDPGTWTVTVGQEILMRRGGEVDARVRPMDWERIVSLQRLQEQDVLRDFLERQQRMSEERFGTGSTEATPATNDTTDDASEDEDATSTRYTERTGSSSSSS